MRTIPRRFFRRHRGSSPERASALPDIGKAAIREHLSGKSEYAPLVRFRVWLRDLVRPALWDPALEVCGPPEVVALGARGEPRGAREIERTRLRKRNEAAWGEYRETFYNSDEVARAVTSIADGKLADDFYGLDPATGEVVSLRRRWIPEPPEELLEKLEHAPENVSGAEAERDAITAISDRGAYVIDWSAFDREPLREYVGRRYELDAIGYDGSLRWESPRDHPPQTMDLNAPLACAREIIRTEFFSPGHGAATLRFWRGDPYVFSAEAGRHEKWSAPRLGLVIQRTIERVCKKGNVKLGDNNVRDITSALERLLNLRPDAEPNSHVWPPVAGRDDGLDDPSRMLVLRNGILRREPGGARRLDPHSPLRFVVDRSDVSYDPDAPEPSLWIKKLGETMAGDADEIRKMQQVSGYLIFPDNRLQKAFCLTGPKRSLKSTWVHVLTSLMGKHAVASGISAPLLSNTHGLQPLAGKSLVVFSDLHSGGRDTKLVAETILKITGGDDLTVNPKYRDAYTTRSVARIVMLANSLPQLDDETGVVASRFVHMETKRSAYGREDLDLGKKLEAELSGILKWALDGLDDLERSGWKFAETASSRKLAQQMEELASWAASFIEDRLVVTCQDSDRLSKDEIYKCYAHWRESQSARPLVHVQFWKGLRAALLNSYDFKLTQRGRERYVAGLAFNRSGKLDRFKP